MIFIKLKVSAIDAVWNMEIGSLATMPAKINKDIPLPTPYSVISSPNHIKKIVPAIIVITMAIIENILVSVTIVGFV